MTREEADKKVEKYLHRKYKFLFFDDDDILADYGESNVCKALFWKGYKQGMKEQKQKYKLKAAKEDYKAYKRNLRMLKQEIN